MNGFMPERLIALREAAGLSQSELGRRAGVGQSTINRLEQGDTRNPRHVYPIAKALGTTADYLMGATDDIGVGGVSSQRLSFRHAEAERDPDVVELAEIDLRFGLGGTFVDMPAEVRTRRFSREWLRNFTHAAPEHLVWTVGTGDSMEPTIRSGEVILIDRSQQTPRFGDEIWAVAFGDIGMIKRLRPMPDGTVQIHSDNQVVRPEVATDGELHVYGRVVAVVRKL